MYDHEAHVVQEAPAGQETKLELQYLQFFVPQSGAVRPGGRFELFTLKDYSIPVRMTDSTTRLG